MQLFIQQPALRHLGCFGCDKYHKNTQRVRDCKSLIYFADQYQHNHSITDRKIKFHWHSVSICCIMLIVARLIVLRLAKKS
jgi:hypothetical protein